PPAVLPLSLHDALPISPADAHARNPTRRKTTYTVINHSGIVRCALVRRIAITVVAPISAAHTRAVAFDGRTTSGIWIAAAALRTDRKSTRLNSSHVSIS